MSRDRAFSVVTVLPDYAAAVAELPVSAALAGDVRGAVAVVPRTGDWWEGMLAARAGGASAVVLADPGELPRAVAESRPWPADIPVIVERPCLRRDAVADVLRARRGSPARLVTVECAGPAAGLAGMISDSLGLGAVPGRGTTVAAGGRRRGAEQDRITGLGRPGRFDPRPRGGHACRRRPPWSPAAGTGPRRGADRDRSGPACGAGPGGGRHRGRRVAGSRTL